MGLKGVIFSNIEDFNSKELAVLNYYKVKQKQDFNYDVPDYVDKWCEPVLAKDGSNELLMIIDERIDGFSWNPGQIINIDPNDPKWFNNNIEI